MIDHRFDADENKPRDQLIRELAELRSRLAEERMRPSPVPEPANEPHRRLAQAHGLIRGITEGTDDLIAAEDTEFRYLFLNDAYRREFRKLWGREIEIGTSMVEAMAPWPEERERARELWSRALKGESFSVTAAFGPSDEEKQVYDLRFNPIYDADGRRIGAAHILRNITDRFRIHQALRESEQRHREMAAALEAERGKLSAIIDNLPLGVILIDAAGSILTMNRAGLELVGFSSADQMFTRLEQYERDFELRYLDGRIMPLAEWPIARAMRGEFVRNYEMQMKNRLTGIRRNVSCGVAPVRNRRGELIRIVCMVQDLTGQRRAERALRQSEEHLRLFVEHAPAAMAMFDRRMRYVNASRRWLIDYGLQGRDLTGQSHYDVFPEIPERWREIHRRGLSGEVIGAEEEAFRRADGSVQWLRWEVRPWRDAAGEVAGILILTEEITERKEAGIALAHEKALLQEILRQMPAGVAIVEIPSGRMLMVNPQLAAILGVETIAGYDLGAAGEFFRNDGTRYRPEEFPLARSVLSGEVVEEEEILIRRHDRAQGVISVSSSPVCDGMGRRIACVALVHDVTEQKQSAEALRQAQKMEAIGRLAGGVAHEFNNMLNVIIGYADILNLRLDSESPLEPYVREIQTAARRSAEMTGQLLAYSRKQMVRPKVIDLNRVIEAHRSMLNRLIGEEIEIRFEPGDIWPVRIDPVQVDQILANLVINARDAIPVSGRITIGTANAVETAHPDLPAGDYVRLTVSDTGVGMEEAILERIFEPYFTTKEVGKGTGLGLATVYGIVKQNHGAIFVASNPGQGTTFTLYLPRVSPVAQTEEPAPREIPPGRETVLVVEDEPQVLRLAELILSESGYRVLKARSPAEAIDIARRSRGRIDLLLSDMIMPGMNGMALQAEIRKIKPDVRTLLMSGYTEDVIGRKALEETAADLIRKPFTREALAERVREVLDR